MRFTPVAGGYLAETVALQWDAEFGAEMTGHRRRCATSRSRFPARAGTRSLSAPQDRSRLRHQPQPRAVEAPAVPRQVVAVEAAA